MEDCFTVEAVGLARSLCLIWHSELKVTILDYSMHHIQARIEHEVFPQTWQLICAYGPPYLSKKANFWMEMTYLVENMTDPWIMIGDLNEVMHLHEKRGGRMHTVSSTSYLENFVIDTACIDLDSQVMHIILRSCIYMEQ